MASIPSGIINYSLPVKSARTEIGGDASPESIGSRSIYTTTINPKTGNKIEGWNWDERVWPILENESYQYPLPINWDPSVSGLTQAHFTCGIGENDSLELINIAQYPSSGITHKPVYRRWLPIINHGNYYEYNNRYYFYSDESEREFISYSGVVSGINYLVESGFNIIHLNYIPKVGIPIEARQYTWDEENGRYNTSTLLSKKVQFTSLNSTETTDNPIWDCVDSTKNEFIVTYSGNATLPNLILNNQYSTEVGNITLSGLDQLGIYTTVGQQFRTLYSPIDSTMGVDIYSYPTISGISTKWHGIPYENIPSGYEAKVDYELGIIKFGDSSLGEIVPSGGSYIGAHYYKTIEVEYEPEGTSNNCIGLLADINSIECSNNNGFICLSRVENSPTSIHLSSNISESSPDVFGPVYIGNSFTRLDAEVTNSNGDTIEDEEITFIIETTPSIGSFGSNALSITSLSNKNGVAYAFYLPPRTIGEMSEVTSGVNIVGATTTISTKILPIDIDTTQTFLYGCYTSDALQGYFDNTVGTDAVSQQNSYYKQFFTNSGIYGFTGLDPITGEPSASAIEWESRHRQIWDLPEPAIFNGTTFTGKKRLVIASGVSYTNPHTFTQGAYGPVQPSSITNLGGNNFNIVYDTSISPLPILTNDLKAFLVIAPVSIKIKASVFNERLNTTINSNEITLQLRVPPQMNGLWIVDKINQYYIDEVSNLLSTITANNQKVPLGWRLRSNNIFLAAALDGATFLDINPVSGVAP